MHELVPKPVARSVVFRATGITADLEACGKLENAQAKAARESPRTTKPRRA
jgi:hypothetical protein